jgi:hypothetical protein
MSQYLIAIHHPGNFGRPEESEATVRDIDVLDQEMAAIGVVIFVGRLTSPGNAKSLRAQPNGKVLVTEGPHRETKERIGGFWVLDVAHMDAALAWARKAVIACRAPVEGRPFGVPA